MTPIATSVLVLLEGSARPASRRHSQVVYAQHLESENAQKVGRVVDFAAILAPPPPFIDPAQLVLIADPTEVIANLTPAAPRETANA